MSTKKPTNQSVEATEGSSISNVIQMVINLDFAGLVTELRGLILKYWPLLLALGFVDGILVWLYLSLRDRHLFQLPVAVGIIAVSTLAVISWYGRLAIRLNGYWLWGFNLVTTFLFMGGVIWQTSAMLNPPRFSPDEFGIAVSRFGEGAAFRSTPLALDITDQVIRWIELTIKENPGWGDVRVMPAGLVTTAGEAQELGRRIEADLIVWGQVVRVGSGAISIHYEISESLDRVSNPIFPILLPAESRFSGTGVRIPIEPEAIHQWVSLQGRMIASFILGLSAYFNRDYATAVEQFETAGRTISLESDGNFQADDNRLGLVYYYLGRSYQLLGKLDEGEDWLKQAELRMPGDPVIPLSIAYGYNSLGREDEVQKLAKQAIDMATSWLRVHPGNSAVAYNRGLAYFLIEQPHRAALEFDSIIEEDPNFYVAYLSSGRAYLAADESQVALERFQTAIQLAEREGTNPSWGYLFLAEAHEEIGDFEQAEEHYRKSIQLAPHVDWMHYRLGSFYADRGRTDAARQSFQQLIDAAFDKAWAHSVMGRFLRDQGLFSEAIREFEIVRRERIFDTLSQIYLAELYLQTAQHEMMLQTYEEALERSPDLEYGRVSFGRALVELGHYARAIEQFKSTLELNPQHVIARFNLGRAYEANGQLREALAEYQEILDMSAEVAPDILNGAHERITAIREERLTPTATLPPAPTPADTPAPTPTATLTPPPPATPMPRLLCLSPQRRCRRLPLLYLQAQRRQIPLPLPLLVPQ